MAGKGGKKRVVRITGLHEDFARLLAPAGAAGDLRQYRI